MVNITELERLLISQYIDAGRLQVVGEVVNFLDSYKKDKVKKSDINALLENILQEIEGNLR
jgi:hypothetical protein